MEEMDEKVVVEEVEIEIVASIKEKNAVPLPCFFGKGGFFGNFKIKHR